MENQQKPIVGLDIGFGKAGTGELGLMITIEASSIITNLDGEPRTGTWIPTARARIVAYELLRAAEEVDWRMKLGLTT